MEVSRHEESYKTKVQLQEFYLGKYTMWDNPYQYGFNVKKEKKEEVKESKVKRRQKRHRAHRSSNTQNRRNRGRASLRAHPDFSADCR